jgi:hypothetical protein
MARAVFGPGRGGGILDLVGWHVDFSHWPAGSNDSLVLGGCKGLENQASANVMTID